MAASGIVHTTVQISFILLWKQRAVNVAHKKERNTNLKNAGQSCDLLFMLAGLCIQLRTNP